ncbi:DUF5683 domain-containing protein [Sphingobacterium sp. HJSM2_6]|uniref:DUF5683 domain-containing protein n=1 Tax=Sphingobacterium sp. HJSM2_6 TaxID=3366264 RepID=UPI003BC33B28
MYRLLLLGLLLMCHALVNGQEVDTIPKTKNPIELKDSLAVKELQDTVKKETRAERKAREKAEKERAKFYYKDILKDSSRLEIERLSRVAWKRSAMVPGWGQYTNQGVWWIKVPIIYGGFVASYFVFNYWQWYYKLFLDELQYRAEFGQGSDGILGMESNWDVNGLVKSKDYGRRNRDLTILVTLGWYGLNIVEAYVDSMLKNRWNMSDDLTFKLSPTFMPTYAATPGFGSLNAKSLFAPGLKMTISIK